jgi:hypothetical protein
MVKKRYRDIPDRINEVAIISILDIDFGTINSRPLTITGIRNKLMMKGYMEKRFGYFKKYAMLEKNDRVWNDGCHKQK